METGLGTSSPLTAPSAAGKWRPTALLRGLGGLFVLLLLMAVATLLSPRDTEGWPIFLTSANLTNLLRQMSEVGIMALAMTLVILTAGIDLSVGSVLALSATLAAKLLVQWQTRSPDGSHAAGIIFVFATVLLASSLVGAANGLVIAYARIQPFVVTLATMIGIRGLAKWLTENENIGLGFGSTSLSGDFATRFSQKPVVVATFATLALLFGIVLKWTVFGRYVRALGDSPRAALYAGLPVRRVQIAVYTLSGLMAGLAGLLHAAQNHQGNPNDGVAYELDVIAAVVIGGTALSGGRGTIIGTVIGTITLGVITNILGLLGADENVKWMTKAVIIVCAVLLQQIHPAAILRPFQRIWKTKQAPTREVPS